MTLYENVIHVKLQNLKVCFIDTNIVKDVHIKSYINQHLCNARAANHLNLSIDELNNIIKIDTNDSKRNPIGEHERYDEVIMYITGWIKNSTIITNDTIEDFLNEIVEK